MTWRASYREGFFLLLTRIEGLGLIYLGLRFDLLRTCVIALRDCIVRRAQALR